MGNGHEKPINSSALDSQVQPAESLALARLHNNDALEWARQSESPDFVSSRGMGSVLTVRSYQWRSSSPNRCQLYALAVNIVKITVQYADLDPL
jgi:hypothetical protein